MTKVKFPDWRATDEARTHRWRWKLAAFAAVCCGTLLAATNDAEQVDSGWAIAIPAPLATGTNSPDIHQQLILRNVLEQSQRPLLEKLSPTSSQQQPAHQADLSGPRVAVRPDGIDGWRPASQAVTPPSTAVAPTAGPALGVPAAEEQPAAPEAGCDCGGEASAAQSDQQATATESTPTLADAYGSLSAFSTAHSADGEQEPEAQPGQPNDSASTPNAADKAPAPTAATAPTTPPPAAKNESASERAGAMYDANSTSLQPTLKAPATTVVPLNTRVETASPPPLTRQLMGLRSRVRGVLKGYYRKLLNSQEHDPWEVMHGMLAYELHSRIRNGGPTGSPITSVGWLCYNKPCKGQTLLYVNPQGELRAKYGVGLQGHLGQLLAMLAQCRVSADYPIHVGKEQFTIRDLIEAEKKTCYPKSELTFKLLALQYYIDLNEEWVNDQGLEWDFRRLVREELDQPVRGAACGGTHRLSALSLTVKTRIRRGEPLDGEYAEAAQYVKKYQQYAFRLQNRDGSLSTQWFKGAGDEDDDDRRIKTTGHILEWLCYSLSDEELRDQRMTRAVAYLANLMSSNYDHEWEVGPRSHATHALLLYDERVFQPFDKEGAVASYLPQPIVAKNNQSKARKR